MFAARSFHPRFSQFISPLRPTVNLAVQRTAGVLLAFSLPLFLDQRIRRRVVNHKSATKRAAGEK